jgi:hypothetical protein
MLVYFALGPLLAAILDESNYIKVQKQLFAYRIVC